MRKFLLQLIGTALAGAMTLEMPFPALAETAVRFDNIAYQVYDGALGIYVESDSVTGWYQDGGRWFYSTDGTGNLTGWNQVSGTWYYFSPDGTMQTGWLKDGGNWYYLASDGAMRTGWIRDGGRDYYLSDSGVMLADTITPDGYRVDASGAWVGGGSSSVSGSTDASAGNSEENAASTDSYTGSGATAYNVDADYAVEADVSVTGSNSVAKVAIYSRSAAVALDIVTGGSDQNTYFHFENIASNAAGGQTYQDDFSAKANQTYHLMLTYRESDGLTSAYVNGSLIGTCYNTNMQGSGSYDTGIEAGAHSDGQTVRATFSNITLKRRSRVSSDGWSLDDRTNNAGLSADTSQYLSNGTITMSGTLILESGNWDSQGNEDKTSSKIYFS